MTYENTSKDSAVSPPKRGGEHVYEVLVEAGVDVLIGLPGTQTLPIDQVIAQRDEMSYVMARHETAVPHVAWGYFEASGEIAATLTVPGPGDTNAMHGLKNAKEDCVPLVHISADVDPAERGQKPIHEIEADTFDNVVKANINVTNTHELTKQVARAVSIATTPPYGPVRLGVPSNVLEAEFRGSDVTVEPESVDIRDPGAYDRAADLLENGEQPVVYVGGGCRRSPEGGGPVRDLARTLDAPVVSTYKGKGVFPEDDDRFVGVAASFLPAGGKRVLDAADTVVALGTDFDGIATAHWELPMGESLVHVNLDPSEIDSTPYEADVPIADDAGRAAAKLADAIDPDVGNPWDGGRVASAVREEYLENLRTMGLLEKTDPAHTPAVLRSLRKAIPNDAIIATDIGGYRLWALELFGAYRPEKYVTAGSWAGMGVGLPAALGAALANPDDQVVCLIGDGGLMMCLQELHTLAERDLNVTVVVFNNRDYGTISKSSQIREYGTGSHFSWESPDFATIAEGFGVSASTVSTANDAARTVRGAVGREGPTLVSVDINGDEPSVTDGSDYESTVDL